MRTTRPACLASRRGTPAVFRPCVQQLEPRCLLSTLDHAGRFWVRLVHVGPDGMKVDPFFNVDLTKFKTGPARGHDMLLN